MGGTRSRGPESAPKVVGAAIGVCIIVAILGVMVAVFDPFEALQDPGVQRETLKIVAIAVALPLAIGLIAAAATRWAGRARGTRSPATPFPLNAEITVTLWSVVLMHFGLEIGSVTLVPRLGLDPLALSGAAVGVMIGLFLTIAVHEIGHVAGGHVVGQRFEMLVAGPLLARRHREGWQWRRLGYAGLLTGFVRFDLSRDISPRRLAFAVASGPAASALSGLAGALLVRQAGGPERGSLLTGVANGLGLTLMVTSILVLVFAVYGFKSGSGSSDGALLRRLIARNSAAAFLEALALQREQRTRRPRQWLGVVQVPFERLPRHIAVDALLEGFYSAVDLGQRHDARAILEMIGKREAELHVLDRRRFHLESAYLSATHFFDPVAARRSLEGAQRFGTPMPTTETRIEAAIALAEGRWDQGRRLARAGLALAETDPWASSWEKPWLQGLLLLPGPYEPPRSRSSRLNSATV